MTKNNNYPLFCQFCGSKDLKRKIEESAFKCNRCGRTVYRNSKPSVCAVIIRDNNVLLVRASGSESWDLPGGFLLFGESTEDGIKRELMEELQAKVKVERFLTALVDAYGSHNEYSLNLFYQVSLISNEIKPGAEIEEYKWFNINKLPHIRYKSTIEVLTNFVTARRAMRKRVGKMPSSVHEMAKQFFSFGENPRAIKIILPSVALERKVSLVCANYPLYEYEISPDDMLSAIRVHSLLTSIYGDIVEVYSHKDFSFKPGYNNIFIGGPPTNSFSYQAVKYAPITFGESKVDRVFHGMTRDYKIGFSIADEERWITEDYTLISKRKKDKNIEFIIGGLRAYGQAATYYFLNEEDFYRQVEEVTQYDSFQILVKIVVEGKACVDWEVVEKTRWETDISDSGSFSSIIQQKREKDDFDIFLSYNSKDRSEVKKIAEKLMERGILPWFDEWELKPGMSWLWALENQIKNIKSAAVFIGKNGRGPWQEEEIEGFINEFKARKCPVIPVILADCQEVPDLPFYLKGKVMVDFRDKEPDPLKQLIKGIPV